nr:MAG TPA: hypothetical protein [Bacteriophage sp.]
MQLKILVIYILKELTMQVKQQKRDYVLVILLLWQMLLNKVLEMHVITIENLPQ